MHLSVRDATNAPGWHVIVPFVTPPVPNVVASYSAPVNIKQIKNVMLEKNATRLNPSAHQMVDALNSVATVWTIATMY